VVLHLSSVAGGGLSQERIVASALALIDREGLEGLTMDGLGAELGVTGMALYRYVASKEALLDRVLEHVQEELEPLDGSLSPRAALERLHTQLWGLLRAHPHLLGALCSRPLTLPAIARRTQENLAALVSAGAGPKDARVVLRTLAAFTLGYAVLCAGASLAAEESDPERDFEPVLKAMLAAMAVQLPWFDEVPAALTAPRP
jgi:AcrR family transcriptional regulator